MLVEEPLAQFPHDLPGLLNILAVLQVTPDALFPADAISVVRFQAAALSASGTMPDWIPSRNECRLVPAASAWRAEGRPIAREGGGARGARRWPKDPNLRTVLAATQNSALGLNGLTPATSATGFGPPRPCHIRDRTGLTPPHSAPGPGSPLSHLRQDLPMRHPCATTAPGPGSSLPHPRRDSARGTAHARSM